MRELAMKETALKESALTLRPPALNALSRTTLLMAILPMLMALICLAAVSTATAHLRPVPVMAGQNEGDACASGREIAGLPDDPDVVVPVREGPGLDHAVIDEIREGQSVSLCDRKNDWDGIVYSKSGQSCGVGTAWPEPGAYSGPCNSGWVEHKYIELVAG